MQVNTIQNVVFKWWFNLLRDKSCPNLPGPVYMKNELPRPVKSWKNWLSTLF